MKKNLINPWTWQDNFGYAQAVEVHNSEGTLYCAGQTAMNSQGKPQAVNMAEQITLSLQNIEEVIKKAGYHPSNIVRINFYTTSIPQFFESYGSVVEWLKQHHCTPASTLLEVSALAFPELSVEIEATVVK